MQAQALQSERRKYPRYACEVGVEIRTGDATSGYWGTLADICLGGCYVNTFSPLPAGTAVVLMIKSDAAQICVAGRTVTSHPGLGMGIEFSGFVESSDQSQLNSLIAKLANGA